MKQLSPLEIINLLGAEPRKVIDNGELAIKNKKIPVEYDILNLFKICGKPGFSYAGRLY